MIQSSSCYNEKRRKSHATETMKSSENETVSSLIDLGVYRVGYSFGYCLL